MRLLIAAALLAPSFANAHAYVAASQPGEGDVVPATRVLRIEFTEAVDPATSSVTLAMGGTSIVLPITIDPAKPKAIVLNAAAPLAPGVYQVQWHAAAAQDGHTTDGAYAFTVGLPTTVQAARPWARATAPGQTVGGGYVTLTSPSDDRVVGGSSPIAAKVEVHNMSMDGGVMRMRGLSDGLPLPAGQAVALAPGGRHVMLVGLKQPLVAGQTVPVQLRFQNAPPLNLMLKVAPIGAAGPTEHAH